MYITQLRISEILGFRGPRNVDLSFERPDGTHAGWTVLAGRNGSGKTSILRCIALAAIGPEATRYVTPNPWASSEGEIAIHATSSRALLVAGYGPFRRLSSSISLSPATAGIPEEIHAGRRVATLFNEEATLVEGMAWLLNLHLQRLEKRPGASGLLNTVLSLLGDGLLPDGYRISRVDSRGLWVVNGDGRFPLGEMSAGYRSVTALVLNLVHSLHDVHRDLDVGRSKIAKKTILNPGVVLIDEIDAHLHISWQKRIGGWLKAHFPNIQFIVTTHSPYACQAADPGGLIRLAGPGEERSPEVVGQDLYQRIIYGSGDDAALSELFGLDSPYSPAADELRHELIALEEAVFAGTATKRQTARYHELAGILSSSSAARVDEVAARLSGGGK
ncbi:AAA family ATPase [Kitasatospora sp. NPDC057965]|uniref:AAA family ATPase n=1 Tax=Kitasatospora sp. NPDC057965 TaxID=3346291 RepID=UPI0036DCBE8A